MPNQNKLWETNRLICDEHIYPVNQKAPLFRPGVKEFDDKIKKAPVLQVGVNGVYNSLIAFFGGVCGFSVLYVSFLFVNRFLALLPVAFLWTFLILIFNSVCEEGVKFLCIKKWRIGQFPYGFLLGLGWGGTENFIHYITKDVQLNLVNLNMVLCLHIITTGILSYFIKKNKSLLGLLIVIILHTGFNLFINWTLQ